MVISEEAELFVNKKSSNNLANSNHIASFDAPDSKINFKKFK